MQLKTLIYKNFVWRGFFYFTSLLLNIAIARKLGAELSGGLYFFLNNMYLAILIGGICLDAGIIYFVSKKELEESKLASFSLVWAFLVSLFISVSFLFFYNDNSSLFNNSFLLFSCFSFTLGTFLNNYFNAFFYSHDDYRTPNIIEGAANLLLLICIPWKPAWLGFIDEYIFLTVFFIVTLVQGILIAVSWFMKKQTVTFKLFPLRDISPAIRYSLAALTGNITYFILYRIDYWFVEYYCLPKSLGNYIQVSRLSQLLIIPCTIIAGTLFPQSSKENISFKSGSFVKLFRVVVLLYMLAALFLLVAGKPLILFLWGDDYDEMYEPLMLTMPGIIFLAVSYLFSPIFAGTGKVRFNIIISFFAMIIVIICNILLVPGYGIKGAAIATTIAFATMMILCFIYATLSYKFSIKDLAPSRNRNRNE